MVFDNWFYLTGTWSEVDGLSLYQNEVLKGTDAQGKQEPSRPTNAAQTNFCIGGRVPNVFGSDFAKFSIKSLAVFDECIPAAHTGSVASFYKDYDGSGKESALKFSLQQGGSRKTRSRRPNPAVVPSRFSPTTPSPNPQMKKKFSAPPTHRYWQTLLTENFRGGGRVAPRPTL